MKKIIMLLGLSVSLMTPHLSASEYITEDLLKSERRSTGFYIKPSVGYYFTEIGWGGDKDKKGDNDKKSDKPAVNISFDALRIAGRVDIGKHINEFLSIEAGFGVYYAKNIIYNTDIFGIMKGVIDIQGDLSGTIQGEELNKITGGADPKEFFKSSSSKALVKIPHYLSFNAIISPVLNININDSISLYGTIGGGIEFSTLKTKKPKVELKETKILGETLTNEELELGSEKATQALDLILSGSNLETWDFIGVFGGGVSFNCTDTVSIDISYKYKRVFHRLSSSEFIKDLEKYNVVPIMPKGVHTISIGTRIYL